MARKKKTSIEDVTPWQNRIAGYGQGDPKKLKASAENWRLHPDAQRAAMRGVLKEVGLTQNVVVNKITGRIIDGHLRVDLAIEDKQPFVPITYVELNEAEEKIILASFDSLGAMASADSEALSALVASMGGSFPGPLGSFLDSMVEDSSRIKIGELTEAPKNNSGKPLRNEHEHALFVKVVVAVKDLREVEEALRITGLVNRGEALQKVCRAYLNAERQQHVKLENPVAAESLTPARL